jgi:hypothetical protein
MNEQNGHATDMLLSPAGKDIDIVLTERLQNSNKYKVQSKSDVFRIAGLRM